MMVIVLLTHIDCVNSSTKGLESPWKWANGSSFTKSFPWMGREPTRSANQRCLRLDGRGYSAEDCSKTASYICELGLYT